MHVRKKIEHFQKFSSKVKNYFFAIIYQSLFDSQILNIEGPSCADFEACCYFCEKSRIPKLDKFLADRSFPLFLFSESVRPVGGKG
jgi:hypothetical protein